MTTHEGTRTHDEEELHQLIDDFMSAYCARDVDRIMSFYSADFVAFDCKPPFQTNGAAAWRQTWEECLPHFPAGFGIEIRDLDLVVGGDMAMAHWLSRITNIGDHPASKVWIRYTTCYRRQPGGWKIVHEHVSAPFDPMTGKAVFTPDAGPVA